SADACTTKQARSCSKRCADLDNYIYGKWGLSNEGKRGEGYEKRG
ncbi:16295_t:CDS:1, partial [Cetraspora pellucida]